MSTSTAQPQHCCNPACGRELGASHWYLEGKVFCDPKCMEPFMPSGWIVCKPGQVEALEADLADAHKRIGRFEAMLEYVTDLGIYPEAIRGGPNAYEKRSDWQEGWNAAVMEQLRLYEECANPEWKIPEKEVGYD